MMLEILLRITTTFHQHQDELLWLKLVKTVEQLVAGNFSDIPIEMILSVISTIPFILKIVVECIYN